MAFNTKEQEIIKYGLANGKSQQDVQTAITNYRLGITPTKPLPAKQGVIQETGQDLAQTGGEIVDTFKTAVTNVGKSKGAYMRGEQGALETGYQTMGQSAKLISDIFGSVIKGAVKTVLPQTAETGLKTGVENVVKPVAETELIKGIIQKYNGLDDRTKRNIESALGLGSLALDVATLGVGKKAGEVAVEQGLKGSLKAGQIVGDVVDATGKAIKPAIETTGKIATGIKDVAQSTGEHLSQIPGRIATNVEAGKATSEAIKQLPTTIAKDAVKNGVDIKDIKYLYKIPSEQKTTLQKLFQATKDFATGASKTNPIEVVGEPIVQKIKQLRTQLGAVGQKLGLVANDLGTVTTEDAFPKVFNSLKKVPGLNGLTIAEDGTLDFANTVLTTDETVGDRKAIQSIFSDAIKEGTGKQKHLLRQELFESLGGKTKSLVTMTDTQSKAYQAIRQGLSDVLDSKNSAYKILNTQYAKIANPLNNMGKFMKANNLLGAGEDILNMKAGLLVRRLTSNAVSNPEIRNVFRALDEATQVGGKTTLSVENLQDFYNVLQKYYPEIVGKTSFQGEINSSIEKASGWKDALYQVSDKIAGKSDAVRRKAIEDAITEALK